MNDYDFDLGSFGDLAAVDAGNLANMDFGNFDLGDIDLGGLEGLDFGNLNLGDIDLGNFDLGDLENLDFGDLNLENLDLGDLANLDFGNLNLGDIDLGDLSGGGGDALIGGAGYEDVDVDALIGGAGYEDADVDALIRSMGDEGIEGLEDIEAGDARVLAEMMGPENRGYYNEITGEFISDENGGLLRPLDERSGTNIESMDGYTYDKKTGTWTTPSGETYTPSTPSSHTAKSGAQVMVDAGALPPGYAGLTPGKGSTAGGGGGGTRNPFGGGGGGGGYGDSENSGLGALLPLLLMMLMMNQNRGGGGSSTTIPSLTATQKQTPYTQQQRAPGYRPGQGGITYFDQTQYAPKMAAGGGISRLLRGPGDGVSDSIPAVISNGMAKGGQPARLARGEYVIDARTVAALGNGSTDAGAERLDKMRKNILRDDRKAGVGKDSKAYRHLMA